MSFTSLIRLADQIPWLLPIALIILTPIAAIFAWQRFRSARMRLNLQSTARLYKKVSGELLGDQMAFMSAFGFSLHPRIIKLIREREDPEACVYSCKRGRRYICHANGRIASRTPDARISLKTRSRWLAGGSLTLLFLPWLALILHPLLNFSPEFQTLVVLTQIVMWFVTPVALWVSDDLMHAHWLCETFDKRYPPARPAPVLSMIDAAPPENQQSRKGSKRPASSKE
ncbi:MULTISPECIES: hypothetical protein [unclassified Lysobacter]|uniref:hypothetical protein n=1 Tax=unclassified Lysobacter TaxID=2635362 RepID=UPI001BE6D2C9|nr:MULTISPECIES: hypothetical protein [unclassified Lysobacter]MBT2748585.1 hypothetical protein [Lysobacter sp. ISL-42]MBT2751520.1 hypothetical protein [Lysobacter sp. ISL-50]MBT2775714.1 hypothetical protein [Lysobacter sp. ISL-54]MBT2782321.1 hypothetical protein [Lysobacter sp. ISL-52]